MDTTETDTRAVQATPEPCQCHESFAAILPMHPGHCCFWPEDATCHDAEVDAWFRENRRRREAS
jgi:hypothetical protein